MITLGIETSCDETAVALYDSDKGLIGEAVFSQIELHGEYGGVYLNLLREITAKKLHIFISKPWEILLQAALIRSLIQQDPDYWVRC